MIMPPENRFFEDIARVANGALGAMSGLRSEVEAMVRQRVERLTADMNLVTRDEFDALRDMVAKARGAQEDAAAQASALEARIAALEAKLAPAAETPAKPRAKKPPAAKTE
jgi:BMFP domain-containing protein YqiC